MSGEAVVRPAARVLLLDPAGRVLLVRFVDAETGFAWWTTPGGGIEPGETPAEAARREVREETGLAGVVLGPCVWLREVAFTWRGQRYRQREHIFVARVEAFEPSRDGFRGDELALDPEHRWWTPEQIERSPERFAPRRLGAMLGRLLEEGLPPAPVEIGT